jgi:hypothetical protein
MPDRAEFLGKLQSFWATLKPWSVWGIATFGLGSGKNGIDHLSEQMG